MTADELRAIRERDAAVSPYVSGFGAERDRRALLLALDAANARCEEMERALSEALELRRKLCRHSDMLDEGCDPDKWDEYCKRWSSILQGAPRG